MKNSIRPGSHRGWLGLAAAGLFVGSVAGCGSSAADGAALDASPGGSNPDAELDTGTDSTLSDDVAPNAGVDSSTPGGSRGLPVMVKELPGSPTFFAEMGGKLHFLVADPANPNGARFLYESDGTADGTKELLKLGNAGPLKAFNGKLFFRHDPTGGTNWEPWTSDGTAAGTALLKDLNPGNIGSGAELEQVLGTTGIIWVGSAQAFYKSNGTAAGTTMMFAATRLRTIVFKNKVFFWGAYGDKKGLWSFDAASTEPTLIKEHINPAYPDFPLAVGDSFFAYAAADATNGREPWVSDGTPEGTKMLKDINPGALNSCDEGGSGSHTRMVILKNKLYLNPSNPTYNRTLWVSDGTPEGTTMLGETLTQVRYLFSTGTALLFSKGGRLWFSNGTLAGSVEAKDEGGFAVIEDSQKWALNGKALFQGTSAGADQAVGLEPFISDGTAAGTRLLADINPMAYQGGFGENAASLPFVIGKTIYFVGSDSVHLNALWKYTD